MKTCNTSTPKGFTLVELLITIAIAGILLAIALFDSTQMSAQEKASNFSTELKRNVKFARAKAMTTGDPVIVCTMTNPGSSGNCLNSWQSGTIVIFSDINNNGTFEANADILHRSINNLVANSQLVHSGNAQSLRFDQRGQLTAGQNGSFIFCPTDDNEHNVAVSVMASGTVRDLGKTEQACTSG